MTVAGQPAERPHLSLALGGGPPRGGAIINGRISHWMTETPLSGNMSGPLLGSINVDVCIIGGGLTGLWTAYWLTTLRPDAKVAILEAERVGYGASGRSTGWLSGKMVGSREVLARGPHGRAGVKQLQRLCILAIDEITELMSEHGVDIGAIKSGYLECARSSAQMQRLRERMATHYAWGLGPDDVELLSADDARQRIRIDGLRGALYSRHCARIQPAQLVMGVRKIIEARGVAIYEGSRVRRVSDHRASTDKGRVNATVVLQATEAYSASLPGSNRELLPLIANMAVTRPLTDAEWTAVGWENYECVSGSEHAYFYGQRTPDGRIALGGKEMTYRYGSRTDPQNGSATPRMLRNVVALLAALFPDQRLDVAHIWSGPLAVPRDWSPSVTFDPQSGRGQASGYVGQGLTGSYLAARTLTDLVCGKETVYSALPWANRARPLWEPEPIRWLGASAVQGMYLLADASEARTGGRHTSRWARYADAISGHV